MAESTQSKIREMLAQNPVVLFMKGTRAQPRCGFSAKATDALNGLLSEYLTVDVLSDEALRQGIKDYGNWPTIPQLYVRGELVGGSDIILQLASTGQLHEVLGVPAPDRTPPTISISELAAQAIRAGMESGEGLALHLHIDQKWQAQFQLAPKEGHEIVAQDRDITLLMDPVTAQRARGLEIDWVETLQGGGLSIRNPNAPPPVRSLSVAELAHALASGTELQVIDVRPPHDRARAPFPGPSSVLDGDAQQRLEALPRSQRLAFLCHFGNSSRQAAEHFRQLGFSDVSNIEGGIDAYSREIDPSVPRY